MQSFPRVSGLALLAGALAGCGPLESETQPRGIEVVIPVDQRPAVAATTPPPAISGGTLTVLKDGTAAVVSDPDRDRVYVVDLAALSVRSSIALEPGDEPGRSVEGAQGMVYVALRGSGAVLSLHTTSGEVVERRAACKRARGIAVDGGGTLLRVACAEGTLVTLPIQGTQGTASVAVMPDLRDVLVIGGSLWLTRFKTAELLKLDTLGQVTQHLAIPERPASMTLDPDSAPPGSPLKRKVTLTPHVAWRALPTVTGALVVHQFAIHDEIPPRPPAHETLASPYGGSRDRACDGIVKHAVTTVIGNSTRTRLLSGSPLPVDIAVSNDQQIVAIAHAGAVDQAAPNRAEVITHTDGSSFQIPAETPGSGISIYGMSEVSSGGDCIAPFGRSSMPQPVVALAFTPDNRIVAQVREPAQLLIIGSGMSFGQAAMAPVVVPLSDESRFDTGHELFHRDSGGGIACASCHPEAGEDGHTWQFIGIGARRTQALRVGLRDTAPFHWGGDLDDLSELMSDVFVGRMGGNTQSPERVDTLSEWLFALRPPAALRDPADPAVVHGRTLFESAEVGCAKCHAGPKLTNNDLVAIDSAHEALQVPSLVGIAYRQPFMHDGCAATLLDRFSPGCGGDRHGDVSALSPADLADLVAYMESL